MPLPPIAETGDLPQGVYHASLNEILAQFGQATLQRKLVGMRLRRIYELAAATGSLKRVIVFGSFVTGKPDPNDVDVFVVMHDTFDLDRITGEARLIFDHSAADAHSGQAFSGRATTPHCQARTKRFSTGKSSAMEREGV